MRRSEYKQLARYVDGYAGIDTDDGELTASKSNGNTYLGIGGDAEIAVKERNGTVEVHFIAEDGTRGELSFDETLITTR